MDGLDNRSQQRLVKIPVTTTILPGDSLNLSVPSDISPNSVVMIELNLQQTTPFFQLVITQLNEGCFRISNETDAPVKLKKNCQAFRVYSTSSSVDFPLSQNVESPLLPTMSVQDILKNITIDGDLTSTERQPLLDINKSHEDIFQPTLPGYDHSFGLVNASFSFAGKARPIPQKLRFPNYGSHQNLLFNIKCQQLKDQGVLMIRLKKESSQSSPIMHGS